MIGRISIFVILIAVGAWYYLQHGTKASSVVVLALNYLARPTVFFPADHVYTPIDLPSAWNGSYLTRNPHIWIYELDSLDKFTINAAVVHFQSLNKTMNELSVADFPLSKDFKAKIDDWKLQLSGAGRGFQVIRGVPVRDWSMQQSEIFFFALGKYLGIPGENFLK